MEKAGPYANLWQLKTGKDVLAVEVHTGERFQPHTGLPSSGFQCWEEMSP